MEGNVMVRWTCNNRDTHFAVLFVFFLNVKPIGYDGPGIVGLWNQHIFFGDWIKIKITEKKCFVMMA